MGQSHREALRASVLRVGYRLGPRLATGGTAVIFEATRLSDGEPAVVKILRQTYALNPELQNRLLREAEVARRVAHPGIVPVLTQGVLEDGSPFLVLERLDGECLARMLRRLGPLPPAFVAAITVRAASILHAVHAYGYVHRDVKPEHIFLSRTNDGFLDVRILDFGVCASESASIREKEAEVGRVYGTPSYVSPEQAAGESDVDARADIFALGTFMFEALTGRLPFTDKTVSGLLRKVIREDAPRVGLIMQDLDLRFDDVVSRSMARLPDQRFTCARALTRALLPLTGNRKQTEAELAMMVNHTGRTAEMANTLADPIQLAAASAA